MPSGLASFCGFNVIAQSISFYDTANFYDLQSWYRGAAMEFARTRTLARPVVRAGMMGTCERGSWPDFLFTVP